jgi:hypothetical protein
VWGSEKTPKRELGSDKMSKPIKDKKLVQVCCLGRTIKSCCGHEEVVPKYINFKGGVLEIFFFLDPLVLGLSIRKSHKYHTTL